MTIGLKKKFQKNAIFDHFWVKFLACSENHNHSFFLFFDFPEDGEHFSYPHGASSTPRSKAMRAWKMKILRKKFFFQIFSKKSKISKFFSFFLNVFYSFKKKACCWAMEMTRVSKVF